MTEIGKFMILTGFLIMFAGLLLAFSDKLPFHPGRLPGDITWQKGNFSFYFPITTSILFSILFSLLWYLFGKFFR